MRRNRRVLLFLLFIGLAVLPQSRVAGQAYEHTYATAFADLAPLNRDTSAAAAEVRVLSAVGMRQVMLDLGPKFERATAHRLTSCLTAVA